MKLEINNLIKEYGEIKALSNVSIELEDVSVLTLIGPSGGGKSTMLRVMGGLEIPDEGRVLINDEIVNYKIQEEFTERFFKEKQDLSLKQVRNNKHMLVKWNKEYILALIAEATEVLNEVDWKMHKKMNLPTDARDRLLEESIDVMKFLLGLMIVNGFTVDDVYNMFKIKSKKVAKKLSQE